MREQSITLICIIYLILINNSNDKSFICLLLTIKLVMSVLHLLFKHFEYVLLSNKLPSCSELFSWLKTSSSRWLTGLQLNVCINVTQHVCFVDFSAITNLRRSITKRWLKWRRDTCRLNVSWSLAHCSSLQVTIKARSWQSQIICQVKIIWYAKSKNEE